MFLLDTNVVSALRRRDRADLRLLAWIDGISPLDLWVSAITILELDLGAALRARRDPAQGDVLRRWIDGQVLPAFEGRILPFDLPAARRCAHLHVPDPKPERDAMVAATALVHRLTLVTRNVRDFADTGVALIDPWADKSEEPK